MRVTLDVNAAEPSASRALSELLDALPGIDTMASAAGIALGIVASDMSIVETNAAFTAMLGYAPDELRSWRDITPAEWHDLDRRAFDEACRAGHLAPYEKEVVSRAGRRVPVLVGGATLPDRPDHVVIYCLDLTERRLNETVMRILADREWLAGPLAYDTILQQIVDFLVSTGLADFASYLSDERGKLYLSHAAARLPHIGEHLRRCVGMRVPAPSPAARVAVSGGSEFTDAETARESVAALPDPAVRERIAVLDIGPTLDIAVARHGETFGVLTLTRHGNAKPFVPYERELGEFIAKQLALAIENYRLREAERRSSARQDLLAREAEAMTHSFDSVAMAQQLADVLTPGFADIVTIDLAHGARRKTVATAHGDPDLDAVMRRWRGTYPRLRERGPLRDAIDAQTASTFTFEEPLLAGPRETETGELFVDEDAPRIDARCLLVVPLRARGMYLGTLGCARIDGPAFDAHDRGLAEEYGRRAALALGNVISYERERRVSEFFQRAALPTSLPDIAGAQLDAVYLAASSEASIGGDWYDAVRLLDGRIMISVGDVGGHGLRAAVTMNAIRQVLRGVAFLAADPQKMLEAADRTMRAESDFYATAVVALYDPIVRTLQCATAGHAPPLLRAADGSVRGLEVDAGPLLGLRQNEGVGQVTAPLVLGAGDTVVFYTDGLTETTRNVLDGERRVRKALGAAEFATASRPAQTLLERVVDSPVHDDIAIVTLRVTAMTAGPSANDRQWRFHSDDADSARAVRHELHAFLAARHWDAAAIASAELVAGELLANANRHAAGLVDVRLEDRRNPVLHVIDRGPGIDPQATPVNRDLVESGRGLDIIKASTLAFGITARPGGGSYARAVLASGMP